ncbi:phosphotransferase [Kribbella sp. NPDC003557]|uniref:phosphotransferase n=1 Tax=Kribbella sp. NPDC003557 TaxID=3154449 RepID=UPI0033AD8D21
MAHQTAHPTPLERHQLSGSAVDAETTLELGAYLVHGDLRSDNVCILSNAGELRLVDCSHAGAGHELHDVGQLLSRFTWRVVSRRGG